VACERTFSVHKITAEKHFNGNEIGGIYADECREKDFTRN